MTKDAAPPDWIADVIKGLEPLTTSAEAAAALRTSVRNLKRWIATGRIKALRPVESTRSRLLIPRTEIERFLRSLGSSR